MLRRQRYDALITDMRLPDGTGLDLLARLEAEGRGEKAIVITAYGSAENAVEALKAGAYDYLTKPVDLKQFRHAVASAVGRLPAPLTPPAAQGPGAPVPPPASARPADRGAAPAAGRGVDAARPAAAFGRGAPPPPPAPVRGAAAPQAPAPAAAAPAPADAPAPLGMAGHSPAIAQVRELVRKVARSMAPVLIRGESGTGKELVARAIHEHGARAAGRFVAVNCSAIPEHLLEAEFFGYRKGAFTGAAEDREGFFQAAHGGTLFLDEIGDLPLAMQAKLLRAIQERAVRPVGAVAEQPVDVRLLSATHKDLAAEVHAGRFRQDLYYRLNVIPIVVPPLRERLGRPARHRRATCSPGWRATPASAAAAAHAACARPAAPPAVPGQRARAGEPAAPRGGAERRRPHRRRATSACDDRTADEPSAPPRARRRRRGSRGRPPAGRRSAAARRPARHLDEVERDILLRALDRHRNNRTAAGASLGLSLRQMRYRMARLGIAVPAATPFGEGP